MSIELVLKDLIRPIVLECMQSTNIEPVFISIQEAAEICHCDRSVIDSLIQDSPANKFPVARLSSKTVRIDKNGLYNWLRAGGLTNGINQES